MKARWFVVADGTVPSIYPHGYFPRGWVYKKDAEACAMLVRLRGGKARVVNEVEVAKVR
jgi:hypothetical protein